MNRRSHKITALQTTMAMIIINGPNNGQSLHHMAASYSVKGA
jgi:hypothetical protein